MHHHDFDIRYSCNFVGKGRDADRNGFDVCPKALDGDDMVGTQSKTTYVR